MSPAMVLVDGTHTPEIACPSRAIIRGDATVAAISAASILAKVARDQEMLWLDDRYPCYGFSRHKGYPTRDHIAALDQLGVSPIHRQSFSPVRRLIK